MSPLESRARLMLWGLCPAYIVYFGMQALASAWTHTTLQRFAWLGAATCFHAAVCLVGVQVLRRRERGEDLKSDERDRAIEAHATRIAYFALMTGAVVVGMMMPFTQGGWAIVNAALFVIVVSEILRNLLIVRGYKGTLRLAR